MCNSIELLCIVNSNLSIISNDWTAHSISFLSFIESCNFESSFQLLVSFLVSHFFITRKYTTCVHYLRLFSVDLFTNEWMRETAIPLYPTYDCFETSQVVYNSGRKIKWLRVHIASCILNDTFRGCSCLYETVFLTFMSNIVFKCILVWYVDNELTLNGN